VDKDTNKGQAFLKEIGIDPDISMDRAVNETKKWVKDIGDKNTEELVVTMLDGVRYTQGAKVSDFLTQFFMLLREEDFKFDANFVVTAHDDEFYGKWPSVLGDAIFLDSNHFAAEMMEMLRTNVLAAMVRNKADLDTILVTDSYFVAMQGPAERFAIDSYAMTSNLFFKDRAAVYKDDISRAWRLTADMAKQTRTYNSLSLEAPIYSMMKGMQGMSGLT
jgi:hypothetical protein